MAGMKSKAEMFATCFTVHSEGQAGNTASKNNAIHGSAADIMTNGIQISVACPSSWSRHGKWFLDRPSLTCCLHPLQ